jgi:predicted aldo/keto reductase-like oxidoreductase
MDGERAFGTGRSVEMAKSTVEVPTRPFGRTGIPVSILALGGWHLGLPRTERESTRLVHAAIDGGITFMDNAWDYGRRGQIGFSTAAGNYCRAPIV